MNADNPDPTEPTDASRRAGSPEPGTTKTADSSKSSTAWAIVAGLAVLAATAAGERPDMPADALIEMATEVGVPDLAAFEAGLESAELITAIVQGAQPTDVFEATIESEAEKAAR